MVGTFANPEALRIFRGYWDILQAISRLSSSSSGLARPQWAMEGLEGEACSVLASVPSRGVCVIGG